MSLRYFGIICLLAFVSCSDYSKLTKSGNSLSLEVKDIGINKVSNVKWKVGADKNYTISQGLRFTFSLPRFDKDSLKQLEGAEVDAWLVEVYRVSSGRTHNILSMRIPLIQKTVGGSMAYSSPGSGSVNIFYAAAAMSERLRSLTCPAMGHRKRLENYEIESFHNEDKKIRVSRLENEKVLSKLETFIHAPPIINGGKTLLGKYYLELAMYNSESKRRKSNLVRLSNYLNVFKEEEVSIEECRNVRARPESGESSGIKSFKFKR